MEKLEFELNRPLMPQEVAAFKVVETLQDKGFEAFIVGGAVRDLYLGRALHDIDIATSAHPDKIKEIFPESYDRGKAFGVVAIRRGDFEFEVATFRNDIGIADHRRPERVEFSTAREDALRRDFTINALFYDPKKSQIIDYTGGIKDLENKIIRFVGKPLERINEDYLRMLRAIRFAYRLNFSLEKTAREAIKKLSSEITKISSERLREELSTIITGPNRKEALEKLKGLGLLEAILPEITALVGVKQPPEFHSEGDVWNHTLMALEMIENPTVELAWTVLLHDVGKPETQGFREHPKSKITFFDHDVRSAAMAKEILTRLKFSSEFVDACVWAISQHMRIVSAFRGMSERKQEKLFLDPNIDLLLDLTKVDLASSIRPSGQAEMTMYQEAILKRKQFQKAEKTAEKKQVEKFTLISGDDIIKILNIPAGPKVGEIKNRIEEAFLEGKISTREDALKMIEENK